MAIIGLAALHGGAGCRSNKAVPAADAAAPAALKRVAAAVSTPTGRPVASGLCTDYGPPVLESRLSAPGLSRLSGFVASRRQPGVLFAVNDAQVVPSLRPILFAIGTDGTLLGTWKVEGARNVDWEDIGLGPCGPADLRSCLYIADVGDSFGRRKGGVQIHVLVEPTVPQRYRRGKLRVERTHWVRYQDGPRDVEALLVDPSRADVYLVEKRPRKDGRAGRGVYYIPNGAHTTAKKPGLARRIGFIPPPPRSDALFTGGAVHPSGRRVLLRTYAAMIEYRLPAHLPFPKVFSQKPIELERSGKKGRPEQKGEAVTYASDGRSVLTTSEGNGSPINRRRCSPPKK